MCYPNFHIVYLVQFLSLIDNVVMRWLSDNGTQCIPKLMHSFGEGEYSHTFPRVLLLKSVAGNARGNVTMCTIISSVHRLCYYH